MQYSLSKPDYRSVAEILKQYADSARLPQMINVTPSEKSVMYITLF